MDHQNVFDKIELQELASKLFMLTDGREWSRLLDEVFTGEVWFDMQSAGGGAPSLMAAPEICEMWRKGFEGLDAVHHQAGHYVINVNGEEADIFAYAVASHYKRSAINGTSRTFVGSYDLRAVKKESGWRLSQFRYNLKYIDGNASLE